MGVIRGAPLYQGAIRRYIPIPLRFAVRAGLQYVQDAIPPDMPLHPVRDAAVDPPDPVVINPRVVRPIRLARDPPPIRVLRQAVEHQRIVGRNQPDMRDQAPPDTPDLLAG